jgi:ABC-type lipoprotein release transport system permease subunit
MNRLPVSPIFLVLLLIVIVVMAALLMIGRVPLSYNVRNLLVRWRMTILTGLAFTLVIGLLTVMLAFVNGMAKLTEGSGHAENVIVLADGANDEAFSTMSFTDVSNIGRRPGSIQSYPASKELYVIASMPIPPEEGKSVAKTLRGVIKRIRIDDHTFVVTDANNDDRAFRMGDGAKVFANNTEGQLGALRPGDEVWIAYEERDGGLWAGEVRGSNRNRFIQVRGIEDPEIAGEVHRLDLLDGNWFGSAGVIELPTKIADDVRPNGAVGAALAGRSVLDAVVGIALARQGTPLPDTAIQAVIGEGLALELARDQKKKRLDVGDVFELGRKKWRIVGITRSEGTTFSSEVWAKRANVGELYGKPNVISSIAIRTGSADEAKEFARYLRDDFKDAKLQTQTETEYFSQLQGTNQQFTIAIGFFTIFMAIGGIFGVMNTMFAAISQRSKDIGVLRILGYARWQILLSFLLESLLIAFAGGLIGLAVGSLSHGVTATSIVGSGQGGFGKTVILRLAVGPTALAIGLGLTLLMGLLGGLLPAWSAMRLKPLDALR